MNETLKMQPSLSDEYSERFIDMLTYIENNLGDQGKTTPHARFEAISVGVAVALNSDKSLGTKDMSWVNNEEFQKLVRSDSANVKAKLVARIKYVADKLQEKNN